MTDHRPFRALFRPHDSRPPDLRRPPFSPAPTRPHLDEPCPARLHLGVRDCPAAGQSQTPSCNLGLVRCSPGWNGENPALRGALARFSHPQLQSRQCGVASKAVGGFQGSVGWTGLRRLPAHHLIHDDFGWHPAKIVANLCLGPVRVLIPLSPLRGRASRQGPSPFSRSILAFRVPTARSPTAPTLAVPPFPPPPRDCTRGSEIARPPGNLGPPAAISAVGGGIQGSGGHPRQGVGWLAPAPSAPPDSRRFWLTISQNRRESVSGARQGPHSTLTLRRRGISPPTLACCIPRRTGPVKGTSSRRRGVRGVAPQTRQQNGPPLNEGSPLCYCR